MQNIKQFECTRFYKEWTILRVRIYQQAVVHWYKTKILCNFLTTNHLPNLLVITQEYETNAEREYVIIGNTALMKCEIPSFVNDFITVNAWVDNENREIYNTETDFGGKIICHLGTHKQ